VVAVDSKVLEMTKGLLQDLDTLYLETFGYNEQPIMMSCYKRALDIVKDYYPDEMDTASKLVGIK
jgi:hypothetical protein